MRRKQKMRASKLVYTSGYNHQIHENYWHVINVEPSMQIDTRWIRLTVNGQLTLEAGYAWDGASGPAIDTDTVIRASLVHDALYQLMRLGLLDAAVWRKQADIEYRKIMRASGASWIRSWMHFGALRVFGKRAATRKGS